MLKLCLVDNYDSFSYNLVELFERTLPNVQIAVVRNDVEMEYVNELHPDGIILGPGPGGPQSAGITKQVIEKYYNRVPIFGVCLGMQCLNNFFDGKVLMTAKPMHGKTSLISHDGTKLFKGIPSPFSVARYHSLEIEVATNWRCCAEADGVPMAIVHNSLPLFGVQFHPESFLSEFGKQVINNFYRFSFNERNV